MATVISVVRNANKGFGAVSYGKRSIEMSHGDPGVINANKELGAVSYGKLSIEMQYTRVVTA